MSCHARDGTYDPLCRHHRCYAAKGTLVSRWTPRLVCFLGAVRAPSGVWTVGQHNHPLTPRLPCSRTPPQTIHTLTILGPLLRGDHALLDHGIHQLHFSHRSGYHSGWIALGSHLLIRSMLSGPPAPHCKCATASAGHNLTE